MAEDRVTITADAGQYFDVLARAGAAGDQFSRTGDRIGAGFIRGDRVVRTATGNITSALLTMQNSGDAAAVALQSLERVFNIGLGPTVAVAAGIATFVVLKREIDAADESVRKLSSDLAATSLASGPQKALESIQRLTAEVQDATQKVRSPGGRLAGFLDEFVNPLLGTSSRQLDKSQKSAIAAGIREITQLSKARAESQERLNQIDRDAISGIGPEAQKQAERQAAFDREELSLSEKIAAIDQEKIKGKLSLFEATKKGIITPSQRDELIKAQDRLAEQEKDSAFEESRITLEKQRQVALTKDLADAEKKRISALKSQVDTAKGVTDFFTDIGSGKFARDFAQQQQNARFNQQGKNVIAELEDARQKGIQVSDPLSLAMLREADRQAGRGTIGQLIDADFSNLLELSKYNFSGLEPLNGLTITLQ